MIAHLKGRLESTGIDHAVIDVGGVGYLVGASARTLSAIGPVGEAATLFTEMLVAEDFIRLVGFATAGERDWFRLLTGVQGVGSRVALAILSALDTAEIARAVSAQDKAMVARANGVGPKLAERIVRELKDKTGGIALGSGGSGMVAPVGAGADAVSALLNLGFRPAEASSAVAGRRRNSARAQRSTRWSGWRCARRRSSGTAGLDAAKAYLPDMNSISLAMPPALSQWVETRLAEGRYADAGDYLRDLVRRDQEQAGDDTHWLRALVEEGLASGIVDAEPEDVIEQIIGEHPASNG